MATTMHAARMGTELRSQVVGETYTVRQTIDSFVANDYGRVVASVALATGNRELAEDGVQDAIVKVLSSNKAPDSLAAWVTVVAANEVRQTMRRKAIEYRVTGTAAYTEPTTDMSGVAVSVDLARAIEELPPRQRDIAMLYYYVDVSVAEIADAMHITQGTVKTQLYRARATLAEILDVSEPDGGPEVSDEH
jgi:RNA polymerase sigma-70 factor (ECF subfamily)